MITSEQLRAARGVLNLNQQTFADTIGVHVATIQRLEAGTGRVKTLSETEGRIESALKGMGFVLVEDGVIYKPDEK